MKELILTSKKTETFTIIADLLKHARNVKYCQLSEDEFEVCPTVWKLRH